MTLGDARIAVLSRSVIGVRKFLDCASVDGNAHSSDISVDMAPPIRLVHPALQENWSNMFFHRY